MKKGEIVLSAVCLAFFSFMFYEAFELRGVGRFGEVGSGFWPLLSLGVTTILSLVWLIGNLRRYSREKKGARRGTSHAGGRRRGMERAEERSRCAVSVCWPISSSPP